MDNGADCYRRFLDGDMHAFDELIALYRQPLTRFLMSFVKDEHLAEDLMIDTFAVLVTKKGQYRAEAAFKTYLFCIGRNLALKHIGRKGDREFLPLPDETLTLPAEDSPSHETELRLEGELLLRCMRTLPRDYRETLFLLYYQDMSYEEAGMVLKKSKKQIANLAYRAKQSLKAALEKEGYSYHDR